MTRVREVGSLRTLTLALLCLPWSSCVENLNNETAHEAVDTESVPLESPSMESAATGRVTAQVTGLRNDGGKVIARLYQGSEGFPMEGDAAYRKGTFEIHGGSATVSFDAVPHGEYALWICHDEDSDGDLKTNFLGMPKEGVGVSGPPPSFKPSYRDARFVLDSALSEHEIGIKYL